MKKQTASLLALVLALAVVLPAAAFANPDKITTCDKLASTYGVDGIDKVDGSSGTLEGAWGSVTGTSNDVEEERIADGALVWLCVRTTTRSSCS